MADAYSEMQLLLPGCQGKCFIEYQSDTEREQIVETVGDIWKLMKNSAARKHSANLFSFLQVSSRFIITHILFVTEKQLSRSADRPTFVTQIRSVLMKHSSQLCSLTVFSFALQNYLSAYEDISQKMNWKMLFGWAPNTLLVYRTFSLKN